MEPLTITAGVVGTLSATLSVGVTLRKFLHGAKGTTSIVNAMISDVKALRAVLESMELTFEEMDTERSESGHIGNHWQNLSTSLEDARICLFRLQTMLEDVNKDVKILDTLRRQARFKTATDQLVFYRQEIQTYKDALHLSLHTINFHNQTLLTQDTAKLISTSENLQLDIQRLAINLDRPDGLLSIDHLKATVTSAATVMSSKTTVVSSAGEDVSDMPDYLSDFGDWFQSESSLTTLQWIYSDVREQPLFAQETSPQMIFAVPPPSDQIRDSSSSATAAAAAKPAEHSQSGSRNSIAERSKSPISPTSTATDSADGFHIECVSFPDKPLSSDSLTESFSDIPIGQKSRHRSPKLSIASLFRRSKSDETKHGRLKVVPVGDRRLKVVPVGDGATGKTCFLIFFFDDFQVYVPTVFENYVLDVSRGRCKYEIALWDTAGQEDYDRLRPLSYPDTDVVLICFAIDNPDSLVNVQEKWILEIRRFLPKTPVILVGLKSDLRNDVSTIGELLKTGQKPVTTVQGESTRRQIGAVQYLECSARTSEGCKDVVEAVIVSVLEQEERQGLDKKWLAFPQQIKDFDPDS
ncbi:hypothetical protein EG327_003723 [Venturia inaequalis]|uniref:Uncharacterized protein n=1 Tax=Venturia inaequalis TaxID=5025 RepID=A0A8H3ZEX2_VENIN|nr:hypothetical protein EG327_003723 [Venturia inaequalis]